MKKIIFTISIRVLIFICALEFFLNFGGFVFVLFRDVQNTILSKKGDYKIICYGESITTYGNESSYPRFLENILNNNSNKGTYEVVDKGVPSMTTTELLRDLDKEVESANPDMVVLLFGINDEYFKKHIAVTNFSKFKLLVLDRIKVYRLFKNLSKQALSHMKNKYINHVVESEEEDVSEKKNLEKKISKQTVINNDDWVFDDFLVTASEIEQLKKLDLPKPGYYEDVTNYHPLSVRNFNEMIDILLNRGVKVVIMQYPLLEMDPMIEIIVEKKRVLFVENQWIFKKVVSNEGLDSYFVDNYGHLNKKGRWLMASTLADKILKYLEKE